MSRESMKANCRMVISDCLEIQKYYDKVKNEVIIPLSRLKESIHGTDFLIPKNSLYSDIDFLLSQNSMYLVEEACYYHWGIDYVKSSCYEKCLRIHLVQDK